MHKFASPTLVWMLLLATQPCHSQSSLTQALDSVFQRHQLVGMSVVTIVQGEVSEEIYLGMSDQDRKIPVQAKTRYRVASISKLVTATALMRLHEQGKFKLDDDVSPYLGFSLRNPAFPSEPITFRMLLSHTSSLREDSLYDHFLGDCYRLSPPPHVRELVTETGKYSSAARWRPEKPGTFFQYSNINYGLIGTLIECLSHQRFDHYLRDSLLLPLGITGSFNPADLTDIDQLAVLYRYDQGWKPQADNFQGKSPLPRNLPDYQPGTNGFLFGPQGGLRVSARELAIVMQWHLIGGIIDGKQWISQALAAQMHTPQWTFNGTNGDDYHGLFQSWGLGVQLTHPAPSRDAVWPDRPMVGHFGEAYGLISSFFFDPVSGNGFIFITNGSAAEYSPGSKLACYAVEEDVFDAIFKHLSFSSKRGKKLKKHPDQRN